LQTLPNSIEILYCGDNQLISLPELPPNLKKIDCNNNKLIKNRKHNYLGKIIYY